jgi:uncharacterized protein with HEPN domain
MRPDNARLLDILLAARRILAFAESFSYEQYEADESIQSAVSYQLLIIGEAAGAISQATKSQLSHIPWRQIVGLRNILAHEYFRVDARIIWNIVQKDLPSLIRQIEPLVPPDESES